MPPWHWAGVVASRKKYETWAHLRLLWVTVLGLAGLRPFPFKSITPSQGLTCLAVTDEQFPFCLLL